VKRRVARGAAGASSSSTSTSSSSSSSSNGRSLLDAHASIIGHKAFGHAAAFAASYADPAAADCGNSGKDDEVYDEWGRLEAHLPE
jgi:hypothetical protein